MVKTFIIAAALVGSAMAACPNGCSGNGICGANDKCSCYQNWQGPDCSLRTCTYSLAWADTADGTNQAHYYAECSNKGVCDRKTGECKCFDGYEGKGCRRSTCPEGCSGHGTCEYIEELGRDWADRRNGPGHFALGSTCSDRDTCVIDAKAVTNIVARTDNTDVYDGYRYELWDAHKTQGCKCDLGYNGADCSHREVPRGDDPLTTVKSETQEQYIKLGGLLEDCSSDSDCSLHGATCINSDKCTPFGSDDEFFLKFHDPYGGVWSTGAIAINYPGDAGEAVAAKVQAELRSLPNGVLSDVVVSHVTSDVKVCTRQYDGVQHISAYDQTTDGNFKNSKGSTNMCKVGSFTSALNLGYTLNRVPSTTTIDLLIRMGNVPGQTGVQYLFEVHTQDQSGTKGMFPSSKGAAVLNGESAYVVVGEINTNLDSDTNIDKLSELSDCSDRGLDDGEGQCECFDGYRGLACEEQEALV